MGVTRVNVAAGDRLGPYMLVAQIGRGAFAPVWLARELWGDVELRTVAIKLFAPGEGSGAGAARMRALEEARALCRVEHPNIVRFYAVAATPDASLLGLVMEYAQGRTLESRRSEEGSLPIAEALGIGSAIASALAAVHAVGLVHRDVKPANVVEANGLFKLIDFGIASGETRRKRSAGAAITKVVVIDDIPLEAAPGTHSPETAGTAEQVGKSGYETSGTLGYMDPATLASGPTPASDLYSLGATLFHCLTGLLPAAAAARVAGEQGLKGEVLDGRARSPSLGVVMPDAPPALVKLMDALLDPDPHKRPRAADAVAWELERIRREIAGSARPLPPEEAGPFRGLGRFEEADRDVYFGRTVEIAAALEMVRTRGLAALVGASGSGKSSLARAGLLPAIQDGELGGWPPVWNAFVMAPGADPWARLTQLLGIEASDPDALADALGERVQTNGRGVVLLVDQLEELVTLSESKSARDTADFLARLGLQPMPGVRCIVAARRDLLGPLLGLGPLGRVLTRGTMIVSPMTRSTWEDVIEQALAAYGYRLENEALREELLAQLAHTVDAMPLVEFALTELWKRRDREKRVLTREALDEIGGLAGALEMHAEQVRRSLVGEDASLQAVLYTVVMATTTPQGTRAFVPERVLRATDERARIVIERFEQERLFVREGDTITLAHEALLVQWRRLQRWLDEARTDRLLADELEREAETWTEDRAPERLWRKRRLLAGEDLVKSGTSVTSQAQKFLDASRRAERRDRVMTGVIGGVALAALVVGGGKYFRDLGRATAEAEDSARRATALASEADVSKRRAEEQTRAATASARAAQSANEVAEKRGTENRAIVAAAAAAADDCMKLRAIAERARKEMAVIAAEEAPPPLPEVAPDANGRAVVPGADLIISSLGPKFSACYQAGLASDPQMRGKVVITATVAPGGNVTAVQNSFNTGISFGVASCVAQAIKGAHFSPPGGAAATLLPIPVVFNPDPVSGHSQPAAPAPAPPPVGSVKIGTINQQTGQPND